MNRSDLQALADLRITEAEVLLQNGMNAGAYYLAGYAIECGLKAAVAKQVNRHDFPSKRLANASHTHDLQQLLGLSGLAQQFKRDAGSDPDLELNWAVVKDWRENSRYTTRTSGQQARDLIEAITDPNSGVLTWLKRLW